MLCRELQRLFELAGVEKLVKKLYRLFGAKLNDAHSRAHEALLYDGNSLLELGAVLLELLVVKRGLRRTGRNKVRESSCYPTTARYERRVVGNDDKEIFCHDVGALRKVFYECDVLAYLDLHQVVELRRKPLLEQRDIRPDVQLARLDEKLHRKF